MMSPQISIAPMMGCTDRHFRYFMRLITRHTLLYTEMITTGAILNGDRHYLLNYHPMEHPLALQLGGCDPHALTQCAIIAETYGYDEVNLNIGCPSDRVQAGRFGACLMAEPDLVAECVARISAAVKIPVTVKTRIGIDHQDSYEALHHFINTVSQAGCNTFIIHARKAWLKGLSPKQNREVPPLRYDVVHQIKKDFPQLKIILNGGIKTLNQIKEHLLNFDGVMIGRAAYQDPWLFSTIDSLLNPSSTAPVQRSAVLEEFIPYVDQQLKESIPLSRIIPHVLGLFYGVAGAREWRRSLSVHTLNRAVNIEYFIEAINKIKETISVISIPVANDNP